MAKHFYTKDVACPYYKHDDPQMVYCEGVEDDTALHLAFSTRQEKKNYVSAKCCERWKSCMIAQMLNRKYDYE